MVQSFYPWLNYLKSLSYWSGGGDFDIHELKKLLNYLDNPQDKIPMIHVAGTNGKGSVSCMVSSILGKAGYKIGLNISPHLVRLNERIVIDGSEASDEDCDWAGKLIQEACERTGIVISFHEALTVAAFLLFEKKKVDFAVVEVGLGGRRDSTNVIKNPAITSIVTIDFDHTKILGDTYAQIAYEKAGIIKRNSKLVTGSLPKEAFDVINGEAKQNSTQVFNFNEDYYCKTVSNDKFIYSDNGCEIDIYPALKGIHQHHNAAVAARICRELGANELTCKQGIETAFWPGRLEKVGPIASKNNFSVVFDCAHNPAGTYVVARYLEEQLKNKVQLVFGVLEVKEWKKMLDMLLPFSDEVVLLKPNSNRALPLEDLKNYIISNGYQVRRVTEDYDEVKSLALKYAGDSLVVGSMYMVGELRYKIKPEPIVYWNRK